MRGDCSVDTWNVPWGSRCWGRGRRMNRKRHVSEMHPRITISSMLPKIKKKLKIKQKNMRGQEEDILSAVKSFKFSTATTHHK